MGVFWPHTLYLESLIIESLRHFVFGAQLSQEKNSMMGPTHRVVLLPSLQPSSMAHVC